MKHGSSADSTLAIVAEPEVCEECHSVSRLTSGLCLNCLLRGALDEPETPSGKEAFKEVLAGVKSRDGDWHIADHEILRRNRARRDGRGLSGQGTAFRTHRRAEMRARLPGRFRSRAGAFSA